MAYAGNYRNGYPSQNMPPSPQPSGGYRAPNLSPPQQPSRMYGNSLSPPQGPAGYYPLPRSPSPSPGFRANAGGRQGHAMPGQSPAGSTSTFLARKRTIRNINLTNGNLVIESPVADQVLQRAAFRNGEEFTHLRYTAATCDPNEFVPHEYTLRPAMYGRHTELFVVMTMYNENDELFCKTMSSVMKNIAYLCTRSKSRTWGDKGWQKAVVCIVADGRNKIHPRVLTCLAAMGCYQEGIAKNTVNGEAVQAHIYEYTTQVMVDPDLRIRGADSGLVPVQVIFCLKEQNKKKLNSHRWFFNAFGPIIKPNVCVLLDVGTRPTGTSLYHLWKAFDRDPQVAGACGEIAADLGKGWRNLLNPLVATQNFEYKMSNILDKPLESVFGYISVLPGAFSAYRYIALQDSQAGIGPLSQYFKGETMHGAGAGVFEANMYLAEDRILCFELVAKPDSKWVLRYVKSAKAETDVPDNIPEFISQRRRWLNGSFFAAAYALRKWNQIWETDHSLGRKVLLQMEFVYNTVSMVFSWFSLANFYLTFFFLTRTAFHEDGTGPFFTSNKMVYDIFIEVTRQLYIMSIIITFICALGNRPQGSKFTYTAIVVLFSVLMMLMLYLAGYSVVEQVAAVKDRLRDKQGVYKVSKLSAELTANPAFRDVVISLASTYGMYFLSSLLHGDPWHMITSFMQYLLMLPAFVNILMVYAFCNTHDVSWGTKGDNAAKADLGEAVIKAGKNGEDTVELEMLTSKEDINEAYEYTLRELAVRPEEKHQGRDATTKKEDYYKSFRTRLVLVWIFSNALLIIAMTLQYSNVQVFKDGQSFNYLTFIFWSVAALSAVRFIGSSVYLVLRALFG